MNPVKEEFVRTAHRLLDERDRLKLMLINYKDSAEWKLTCNDSHFKRKVIENDGALEEAVKQFGAEWFIRGYITPIEARLLAMGVELTDGPTPASEDEKKHQIEKVR